MSEENQSQPIDRQELKRVLEAILFASEKPLSAQELKEAFENEPSITQIEESLDELGQDYQSQNRGFMLIQIAGGHQIVTDPRFSIYLKRFYQAREKKKLSQVVLETLSIIAYRQPATRADIEFIRGVNVDNAVRTLMDRGLVKIVGRKEVPGRPMLFGTTKEFLDHFGLGSLKELPALAEFTEKDIDPGLLPPEFKMDQEPISEYPSEIRQDVQDALSEDGEQKPVGCDNTEGSL